MALPAATIVVPLRRQVDAYLETSLRSALAQSVPVDVIVVTAPDTPSSNLDILHGLARGSNGRLVSVGRRQSTFAGALNTGFEEAHTERVGILLSDDWLDPDTVESALEQSADIVSAGKRIWRSEGDAPMTVSARWVGNSHELEGIATLEERARYVTHFLLMSRELVLAVGGVDETLGDLSGVDDYEMVWRMLEAGASVGFTATPHYNLRDHRGERLTLRPPADHLDSLNRMLDKHHVVDPAARNAIIAAHVRWYGRTISDVLDEDAARS